MNAAHRTHPSPETLHQLGVLDLVWEKFDSAAVKLEEATALAPDEAAFWNDLSVAYLAQADGPRSAEYLLKALGAADRAIRLNDRIPEAFFNRALAASGLFLRGEAIDAWEEFLRQPSESGWRNEARRRLAELRQPSIPELWSSSEWVRESPERKELSELIQLTGTTQPLRERAMETLFPEWAESVLAGETELSVDRLSTLLEIGQTLVAADGDATVMDAVRSIQEASNRTPESLMEIARAHLDYAEGRRLFKASQHQKARPLLVSSRDVFARWSSPFQTWSEVWLAGVDIYRGNHDAALAQFTALQNVDSSRYPALAGMGFWGAGLIHLRQGRFIQSLEDCRQALQHLKRARECENAGQAHVLAAENLERLGAPELGWKHRHQALKILHRTPDSVWLYNALLAAAGRADADSTPDLSLVFLSEAIAVAQAARKPEMLSEAYLWRARSLCANNSFSECAEDLLQARTYAAQIVDAPYRETILTDLLVAEGETPDGLRNPAVLQDAVHFYERMGLRLELVSVYLTRARIYRRQSEFASAEEDLRRAIDELERQNRFISDPQTRRAHLETTQRVFDEMIDFQVRERRQYDAALEYSERARSLSFQVHSAAEGHRFEPAPDGASREQPLAAIRERLPEQAAAIEYAIVKDRLLIWIVQHGGIDFIQPEATVEELNRLVSGFAESIRKRSRQETIDRFGSRLYEILLAPVESRLSSDATLLIVPDKILHQLPFQALKNPATGAFLIETRAVSLVPSLRFLSEGRNGGRFDLKAGRSALLAGDAEIDPSQMSWLPRLRFAGDELRDVGESYPRTRTLAGAALTRRKLLEELDRHDVVHFAGHASIHPGGGEDSFLLLSRDPESPGDPDSGVLYGSDLAERRFQRLQLAVLSACRSATTANSRTQGISGLAGAFLEAGVPAVVATLWDVDDREARELSSRLHQNIEKGLQPPAALQQAQLSLLRSPDPHLRAPAAWAAFQCFGFTETQRQPRIINQGG